jgi:hypothetical protein
MSNEILMFLGCATAGYVWLCAIVAPLVTAVRSALRERAMRAVVALGLALAAALLWTIVPLALVFLLMMLQPAFGSALLQTRAAGPGVLAGVCGWLLRLAFERRIPRLGATFEAASALAIVAAVDDSPRTLRSVESLYRALAIDGRQRFLTLSAGASLQPTVGRPQLARSRGVRSSGSRSGSSQQL